MMRYPLDIWPSNRGLSGRLARFLFLMLAGFGTCVVGTVIFLSALYVFLWETPCTKEVIGTLPSPSNAQVLVLYDSGCGTYSNATLARSVADFQANPTEPFFVGLAINTAGIAANWLNDAHLIFRIPEDGGRVQTSEKRAGGVEIDYQ